MAVKTAGGRQLCNEKRGMQGTQGDCTWLGNRSTELPEKGKRTLGNHLLFYCPKTFVTNFQGWLFALTVKGPPKSVV